MIDDLPALVDTSVLDEFPPDQGFFIKQFFGEHFIQAFIKKQTESALREQNTFQRGGLTLEEYAVMSRDRQLLWRFWQDLLSFSEDCKRETTADVME